MELRRLAALLFGKIDYLISPTAPIPAFTASGLPIGVQIIGRRFDDHGVLKLAKAWERARGPITNWPKAPS
jgi:Asp-tRNA(Asn)/Glu-tRNA(Gln) amidotransferase A subunit family amidase